MENETRIIMDNRERVGELIEGLKNMGLFVDVKSLPVGDYVISDRMCIERKTISDFESSIMSGRLFEQLERLKESYEFPLLVLEGNPETFRLKQKVINGAIVSIYVDFGIPIVLSLGPENTAEIIAMVAKREQNSERRAPSVKGSTRSYSSEQFQIHIIGNLPGVGAKLAKSLLKHFGSIRAITNASIEELMSVEKIGKKKATVIHKTLNHQYIED